MRVRRSVMLGLLAVWIAGPLLVACGERAGEVWTDYESIELGDARSVRAEIDMGAGRLKVDGGASKLLEATFIYNYTGLKPEVTYRVRGGSGQLIVRQPSASGVVLGDYRYEWDLRLNNEVPMEVQVNLGAGDSILHLGDLALRGLDINMGAGKLTVDLVGDWRDDLDVHIRGGAGQAILWLPRDVGVRVEVRGGIGKVDAGRMRMEGGAYVNDAYGRSEVEMRVLIEAGVGAIDLEVAP